MDIYSSPKIKTTVKTVGTLIIIIFYSSLVDFYYIGPYIHNILSEIKFLANTNSVTAKAVQKIFLEINAMMFDAISFFNGFNRSVTKDMKLLLSEDVIMNERIFLNLRGVPNSKEILNMCRDYSGGKKYKELIESETIKPKVKSDVRVIEQPKYGDEIKLEQNDTGIFKFLKFKNKVKKNLFLDEEIDINEYSEYKNDYEKSIQKLKFLNFEGESYEKKEENDILEVFDFINNVTNTDKDNQTKIKDLTFWTDTEPNTENDASNNEEELTFGFDFDFEDKDKPNKKTEEKNKTEIKTKKEKEKEKEKIDSFFDFKKNMSNSSNKLKKVENKNLSKNTNENKENKGKEGDILIDFDFPDDNKKDKKDENKINKTKSNELVNKDKNKINNENNNLFDFSKFPSSNPIKSNNNIKNVSNNNSKLSQSTKINDNDLKNNKVEQNVNQLIDMFDFSNDNSKKKDEKEKTSNKNNILIENDKISGTETNQNNNKNDNLFNFDNFNAMSNNNKNNNATNNKNPIGFDFSSHNKGKAINNNIQNQNNLANNVNKNENMTLKKDNTLNNIKSNNNNVFDFTNVNFTKPKNNTSIQNQKKDNLNNNQNITNKKDNLNDLLSNFNFGNNQPKTTDMTQYIPSFPNNNNNNNNNNFNFNPNNSSSNFNFSNFDYNNYNNQLALFQQNDEEINVELKEQICFYYKFKSGNKIVNAINQGYLGLSSEKEINKSKDFNITFKSQKFKNPQYIQKNFDKKLVKLDDLNYKVHFNNLKKSEKLLEYIINPNILAQNRILEPFIGGKNNTLNFGFMYNNSVKKEIQKIDLNIIYKNMITNNNMIKSDGNITNNNNNQIIVSYNGKVNEAKIIYPININVFALVSKITITVNLEKDIMSEVDVEIKDNENQILLNTKKNTQISYEFS